MASMYTMLYGGVRAVVRPNVLDSCSLYIMFTFALSILAYILQQRSLCTD